MVEANKSWKVGKYKFGGAVLDPDEDCVYCLPYDGE